MRGRVVGLRAIVRHGVRRPRCRGHLHHRLRSRFDQRWQMTNSGNTFSRLGFRGTRRPGRRLAAGFWLEAGLQNDNGIGFGTNTNNQASGTARRRQPDLRPPIDGEPLGRLRRTAAGPRLHADLLEHRAVRPLRHRRRHRRQPALLLGPGRPRGARPARVPRTASATSCRPTSAASTARRCWRWARTPRTRRCRHAAAFQPRRRQLRGPARRLAAGGWHVAFATGKTTYASGDLRVSNLGVRPTPSPR